MKKSPNVKQPTQPKVAFASFKALLKIIPLPTHYTGLQCDEWERKAKEKAVGKRIIIKAVVGRVLSIKGPIPGIEVFITNHPAKHRILCVKAFFSEKDLKANQRARLVGLKSGDFVEVRGIIKSLRMGGNLKMKMDAEDLQMRKGSRRSRRRK